jgi:predicted nucleic acid-binding protein
MVDLVLVDTGPLVAGLRARERHHAWTRAQLQALVGPLITCEAVLSEAFFLLQAVPGGHPALAAMIDRGHLEVRFDFQKERSAVLRLLKKYSDTPMNFADACLVRMSEVQREARLFTLDSDFDSYRRNGRERIPVLAPW